MSTVTVEDLREKRANLYQQMQALLARAMAESRDLSTNEDTQFKKLEAQFDAVSRQIERGERVDGRPAMTRSRATEDTDGGGRERRLSSWLAGEFRALVEGSGSGSYVVPPSHAREVWDRLAPMSVGLRSGFSVIETDSDELHLPKVTGDASAAWTAEGATISASDPTISEVVAYPRKLAALTQASNELLADSNPSALDIVVQNLLRSLALKLDLGFFEGSGAAPEIRGLKNVVGIQEVSMGNDGAALADLDPFADAISLLEQENATATAIVMHPRTWKACLKLKEEASGNNKPLLQDSAGSGSQGVRRSIYGVPVYLTSQLSITETQGATNAASSVYVYQADQIVAVRREDARVEVDRSRLFNSDQSEIRGIMRWDVVVPNVKAICRIKGIKE